VGFLGLVWGQNAFVEVKDIVFVICLKQNFLGTTNFGGAQKNWRGTTSECLPRG